MVNFIKFDLDSLFGSSPPNSLCLLINLESLFVWSSPKSSSIWTMVALVLLAVILVGVAAGGIGGAV